MKVIWKKQGYIPKAIYDWIKNQEVDVVGICPTKEKVDKTDIKVKLLCVRV